MDDGTRTPIKSPADRHTPLIYNCWYVAGWSSEVGAKPLSRRILNRNICLYRAEDGAPIALHDRCPHRSMPLSMGYREGDSLRCGYHGLLFDRNGDCIEIPSQPGKPPKSLCVRRYPVQERGPLIWIWTGDPALAADTEIPDHRWMSDASWDYAFGSLNLGSNYVGLHENLLDLTHFTYLHPGNIGTPEFARAKVDTEIEGDIVRGKRFIPSSDLPGLYTASTGLKGKKISRLVVSEFLSPAMHSALQTLTVLDPDPGSIKEFNVRIVHFVTPESQDSTHYFFAHGRNFAVPDKRITKLVEQGAIQAFLEDASALEAIRKIEDTEPGYDRPECSIKSDQPGIAMRRRIQHLAIREAAAASAA